MNVKFNNQSTINIFNEAVSDRGCSQKNENNQLKNVEKSLILGLKEISYLHSGVFSESNKGATPSLNSLETPLDYYHKNKDKLTKLTRLYSETLNQMIMHDESLKSVLGLVNKGYLDIISELMSKIQIDPYTHLGGRMQVLENHRKVLEEKINIYKDDAKDLEKCLISKDKELDHQLENGRKIKEEKDLLESKLKELRKKVMFTKECLRFENDAELLKVCNTGKAFSTRSYHTPPQVKKMKEIAVRKDFNLAV